MRRLILPSSLVLLAASLCALASLSPAGAAGSVPHIICPEQQSGGITCCPPPTSGAKGAKSRPHIIACCPVPTSCCPASSSVCCTQTTCCVTPCTTGGLTIASSPDPSTAGRKVVISGGFTSNPPAAGATVALWRELSGQSSFHQVAQTTTGSAGQYKFTLKPGMVNADQQWYVSANGLQSPTLHQVVNAVVGLAGLHSIVVGHTMVLRGHVTPSHAGQIVLIEQRKGSQWPVIARPRLGHGSNYGVMHRFARSGSVTLRTVLPGDARNGSSASGMLTVTVKP
jgi:hypothetical protein